MARSDPLIIAAPLDCLFFRGLRRRHASKTTSARRKSSTFAARRKSSTHPINAPQQRTWVQLAALAPPRPSLRRRPSRYPIVSLIGITALIATVFSGDRDMDNRKN